MAVADYFDTVQKVYIAFYQRPADPAGLYFWSQRVDAKNGNLSAVIDAFANSAEATRLFFPTAAEGETLYDLLTEENIGGVIDAIYLALFNRAPDEAGKQFYVDGFADGTFTAGNIMLNILNGAQGDDAVAVANKLEVASLFTTALDPEQDGIGPFQATYNAADEQVARDWLATVTSDTATRKTESEVVTDIQTAIADSGDAILGQTAGQTFTLTTGVDNYPGTDGNDSISGVSDGVTSTTVGAGQPVTQTFGGLDVVNGGNGTDTLTLANDVGTMTLDTSVTVGSIENLVLRSALDNITADVQGWTGLQSITVDQRGSSEGINIDTKSNVTSVTVTAGATVVAEGVAIDDNGSAATTADTLASVSVTGAQGAVAIGSDALANLTLVNSAQVATVTNTTVGHTLNVTANKQSGAAEVVDANATTINVTAAGANSTAFAVTGAVATTISYAGDKNMVSTLGAQAANLKINSSGTGTLTIGTTLDNDVTFTGGAGKETITINSANTKATAMGAGDDKVNVSGTPFTTGTIDGGDGTDTIAFSAADAAALSAGTTYEAQISNFEKVGLGQVAGGAANVVNMANLDDINYVVSAGTAAASGTAEVQTITFGAADASGGELTVGGVNVTIASSATAGAVSNAVAAQSAAIIAANPNIASVVSDGAGLVTVTYTTTSGPQAAITAVQNASGVTFGAVTPTDGTNETLDVDTITVGTAPIATGQFTVTVNGTPVTVNAVLGQTVTQVAAAIEAALDADATVAGLVTTSAAAGVVTITGRPGVGAITTGLTVANGIFHATGTDNPVAAEGGVDFGAPVAETQTFTVTAGSDATGGEILVAGARIALAANQTIDQVGATIAANVAAIQAANANVASIAYNTANDTVTVTYNAAAGDVGNITLADNTTTGSAITVTDNVVIGVAGSAAGTLNVTNMAKAGKFELTAANAGATTVTMKDATGAADSLNLKLNGAANLAAGAVTVAGVETIAIVATDSSADDVTVTNPTAVSTLALNAAAATTITLSGNHGVDFTGSTVTKVTSLDASGVVANVNTTGKTAAQIVAANGTAGAVTFTTVVDDKDVTIKTGNGDDVINAGLVGSAAGKTASATITTGAGEDYVYGGADNDTIDTGSENDWVDASAGADTITLGAGNDTYQLWDTSLSVLAKYDTITDFSANTYGFGTAGAADNQGANLGDATKVTGDVIDLSWELSATGIDVLVVTNAADAQTFIQNTGNNSTDTGISLDSSSNLLYIDVNSDGVIDSVVKLTGVSTITEAAFAI